MAVASITSGSELVAAMSRMSGYIVNKDSARSRYHRNSCVYISPEAFGEKVLQNDGVNGGYFAVDTHREAASLGAVPCKECNP